MSEASASVSRVNKKERQQDFASTGPDTLSGRYLRQFWHPVAIAADVAPGKAKPIKIMSEEFTLYRGASGTPHIVSYRCPHRGTQLSAGWVQGDDIRCLYHGWKFGGNGQCLEMPYETEAFAAKVRIRSYPAGEFLGLIWGYFGEGELPPFPPFPDFEEEGHIETRADLFPCNYFQTHENDLDPYHAVWTHSRNDPHGYFNEAFAIGEQPPIRETDWGILETMNLGMNPNPVLALFPPCTVRTLFPSPSGLYEEGLCAPNRDGYVIHVPIDDDSCIQYFVQHVRVTKGQEQRYAERFAAYTAASAAMPSCETGLAILEGRLTFEDVADHPFFAVVEDVVAQAGQGRIADRRGEWLGSSDANIILMRKMWARELDCLAEGRQPKKWSQLTQCPDELLRQKESYRERGLF